MNIHSHQSSKRPRRQNLNRDKRIAIQTIRRHGFSYLDIARKVGLSQKQVQYARERGDLSEFRSPGRPPVRSGVQADELENFVCSSRVGRFMAYVEFVTVQFSHWNIREKAIWNAHERIGN